MEHSPTGSSPEARVFVGVPTHNRPRLVPKALESLRAQTCADLRVVVSDNRSEPDARASVEAFVADLNDPRFSYVLQPEDRGEYGQGRYFLSACDDAEYLVILHDDDVLDPAYLETAVRRLDENPELSCFCSDPWIFDVEGKRSGDRTAAYLADHGRNGQAQGPVPVLESLLRTGFIPISGTVFRTSALRESGFIDEDCTGNYPFEFNVLLRLGEIGAQAWYEKDSLIGYCFHEGSLRSTLGIRFNPQVMDTMILLLERRQFSGTAERLRRRTLAFCTRCRAAIRMADGDAAGGRREMAQAVRLNPLSVRNWTYATGAFLAPFWMGPHFRAKREALRA